MIIEKAANKNKKKYWTFCKNNLPICEHYEKLIGNMLWKKKYLTTLKAVW